MTIDHPKMVRAIALGLLVVVGLIVASGWTLLRAGDQNPCALTGNLTVNCAFDVFEEQAWGPKTLSVPQGWRYFIVAGRPDYRVAADTYWGPPSLELVSIGMPFTAGVYQQVAVTPGVAYQADIGWAGVSNHDFERKLGLDPTGGTDPLAPTVIWGPSDWVKEHSFADVTVSARATGPIMTLFVWIGHPASHGDDAVYLDAVGLWPDPSQPAFTLTPTPSATPTRRPPTRTPTPVPATHTATALPPSATPSSTPSGTPTQTSTPLPSETPTATPTWTATPSPGIPTNTPPPTLTPLPTAVQVAKVFRAQLGGASGSAQRRSVREGTSEAAFLYVATAAVMGALLLAGVALWVWKHARKAEDGAN